MTAHGPGDSSERITVHIDPSLRELIPAFLENRQRDLETVLEGLETGNYEAIRIVGHGMKGTGGGYGFDAITTIGRSLEEAAENQDVAEIRRMAEGLADYLQRVDVVYD